MKYLTFALLFLAASVVAGEIHCETMLSGKYTDSAKFPEAWGTCDKVVENGIATCVSTYFEQCDPDNCNPDYVRMGGIDIKSNKPKLNYYPLVINSSDFNHPVFTMQEGACLKGPLQFYKPDSTEILFKLNKNTWYPADCGK